MSAAAPNAQAWSKARRDTVFAGDLCILPSIQREGCRARGADVRDVELGGSTSRDG